MTKGYFDAGASQEAQSVLLVQGAGPVVIEDASLLFAADFLRDGPDLVLRNAGAEDIRIVDYFRTADPVDLQSPDGATLRGSVVERLAGPEAPGQYAQAGPQGTEVPIGQVEVVEGAASVQRGDGTTEPLTQSARIFLGDVVQTLGDSTLSITFVDGTIFTLSADSRMVIDELIYSPDSNDNSATFNLVQGGFVFIAGQVAGTGGMEVNTPAATMGIRGTTVLADVQTQAGVSTVEVTLTRDPDGGIGRVELFDLTGNLITTITSIDSKWIVSTDDDETREVERTAEDEAADNVLIAEAVAAYQIAQGRFAQDGSFLQLDNLPADGLGTDDEDGGENEIDLDGEDAEELEAPEEETEPDGRDDSFDEGSLQTPLQEQTPDADVFRTALEDAEDGPVAGQLSAEVNLQGEYVLVSGTSNGTVQLASDGSYSYTPVANFNGQDQFVYAVTGPDGVTTQGTVTINVLPVNDPPEIEDASLGGEEDRVLLGTAEAVDIDSPVLTYSLATGAENGSVVVTETGAWSYTPDPDFAGTDSFEIAVSDGDGAVATQRVTVSVAGVNDAPVIVDDGVSAEPAVFEDAAPSVSGQLTANDPDAGDVLTWTGSATGDYGTFTIDGNGAWTYTLGPAAETLAQGQEVSDSFTATVTDLEGATAEREITIAIIGSNDAPEVAAAQVEAAGDEDQVIEGSVEATDIDSPQLFYSVAAGAANGSVVVTDTGAWSYTPAPDFAGTDSFDIAVSDGSGAVATQRVTVTVRPVNDAPVILDDGVPGDPAVTEDSAPGVAGQLTASDPDAGDQLTWSGSATGTYGSLTVDASGAWAYTLGPAAQALAQGQQVTESFTATVTDLAGATDTREITIAITGTNDAPVASNVSFAVTGAAVIEGTLAASDPDAQDVLGFTLGESGPQNGSLELRSDGSFTYTPEEGFAGLDGFDYVVTDPSGASTTARVTLSVATGPVQVPGGGQVSVNIYPDPDIGPAGQIVASSSAPPDVTNLNLVFALDRSGSVGSQGWATQINSLADALESLAEQFDGSATQVDVTIVAFSSFAEASRTYDLTDPELIPLVRSIPFTGGGTIWSRPLLMAETYFDAQPADELNFLYFVSDGEPLDSGWPDIVARLQDKDYALEIEAFGVGRNIDEETLAVLDPDPVLLNGPEDLLGAIETSPLFAPKPVDLSVRLIADGVDLGEVADETVSGITTDGLDTKLALADIPGLAGLLGEDNLISVTVGFDLDGNESTSEIDIFTSQVFAKQASAVSLDGTGQSDLLLGSDFADVLVGNGGNDILLGFGGDDVITTGAGLDHVRAGAGDDLVVLESAEAPAGGFANLIDGGSGRDVLKVGFGNDLDTAFLPLVDLSGVEAIDLDNGAENHLGLTLEDVLGISDEADTELEALLGAALPESLTIYGDGSDSVTLTDGPDGNFVDTRTSVTDSDDNTLNIYTYVDGGEVLATIAVDSEVAVSIATATG